MEGDVVGHHGGRHGREEVDIGAILEVLLRCLRIDGYQWTERPFVGMVCLCLVRLCLKKWQCKLKKKKKKKCGAS